MLSVPLPLSHRLSRGTRTKKGILITDYRSIDQQPNSVKPIVFDTAVDTTEIVSQHREVVFFFLHDFQHAILIPSSAFGCRRC
jgi:hypothetical protein